MKPVLDKQKESEERIMATLQDLQTAISNLDQAVDLLIAKMASGSVSQAEIDAINAIALKVTTAVGQP